MVRPAGLGWDAPLGQRVGSLLERPAVGAHVPDHSLFGFVQDEGRSVCLISAQPFSLDNVLRSAFEGPVDRNRAL